METNNKTLFKITAEFFQLESILIEAGGEITPEMEELLNVNQDEFLYKLENYGAMIRKWETEAEAYQSELNRLSEGMTRRLNAIKALKKRALDSLMIMGEHSEKVDKETGRVKHQWKAKAGLFDFSTRMSQAVEIVDENNIPVDLTKYSLSIEGDLAGMNQVKEMISKLKAELVVNENKQPDKNAIKEKIKSGEEVKGAELKTNYSLQIK